MGELDLAQLWSPIRLTIELAFITTVLLLIVGTPIAWWLARSKARWKEAVATIVAMAPTFWPAEDYHQDFWKGSEMLQNGLTRAQHYARYRVGCGKNGQVEAIWGKDAFRGLDGHV